MKLLHSAIMVTPEKPEVKEGQMIAPVTGSKSQTGTVVTVGTEVPSDIKSGDTIIYYEHSLTEINLRGEKKYVVDFDDVIGVL